MELDNFRPSPVVLDNAALIRVLRERQRTVRATSTTALLRLFWFRLATRLTDFGLRLLS